MEAQEVNHPNLSKITEPFSTAPGTHFYRVSFDQTDFPDIPDGSTQDVYFPTERALTLREKIRIVDHVRAGISRGLGELSDEEFRKLISQPFS